MVSTMDLCLAIFVITMSVHACSARNFGLIQHKPNQIEKIITVNQHGKADFNSIQKAIDSIPSDNTKWIHILISQGTYREKVNIPQDKSFLFIEGENAESGSTEIIWGDHDSTDQSCTLTIHSDNIILKGLVVKNTYGLIEEGEMKPAVAVRLLGDKHAIYQCSFIGLQDTLWDAIGRHYFKDSYISGVTDFIWGFGQSIYEGCQLDVTLNDSKGQKTNGVITAQGRESANDPNGFVFKGCKVTINGGTSKLGRAYRPYSRVIFYQCDLPNTVDPLGWDAWNSQGHEETITYVEDENTGEGANTSGRVPWMKKLSNEELSQFTSLSFINQDDWISKLPSRSIA